MNKLFGFLFCLFILSCDTVTEEYLYTSSDPEYALLKNLAYQECLSEASILASLDATGDFENTDELNRIYKITQDTDDAAEIYIKIITATATEMRLAVSPDASTDSAYKKIIVFEKTDHDALIDLLELISCDVDYKEQFSASGLDDNDTLTITWNKETIAVEDDDDSDDEPEEYSRRKDVLKFDNDFPLFFYFYNAEKSAEIKSDEDSDDLKTPASKISFEEVTEADECDSGDSSFNNACDFSDTSGFAVCNIAFKTIPTSGYLDELFTTDASCKFLESAEE